MHHNVSLEILREISKKNFFSSFRSVALVVPNANEMISLASVNSSKIANFEDICRQPSVVAMAFKELKDFAMKHLEKFEIPKQVSN